MLNLIEAVRSSQANGAHRAPSPQPSSPAAGDETCHACGEPPDDGFAMIGEHFQACHACWARTGPADRIMLGLADRLLDEARDQTEFLFQLWEHRRLSKRNSARRAAEAVRAFVAAKGAGRE